MGAHDSSMDGIDPTKPFIAIERGSIPTRVGIQIVEAINAKADASDETREFATAMQAAIDNFNPILSAVTPTTVLHTVDCNEHGFEALVVALIITPVGDIPTGFYYATDPDAKMLEGIMKLPTRGGRTAIPDAFSAAFGDNVEPAPDFDNEYDEEEDAY